MAAIRIPRITTAQRTPLVLQLGELVYDTDLNQFFGGDGVTAGGFPIAGGGGGIVTSVFGRNGAVVAVSGDYDAIQIDYDNSGSGLTATEVQAAIDEVNTKVDSIPAAPVDSVNGQTGVVVLDADDIDDSLTTNKFATQAELDQIATNQTDISTLESRNINTNVPLQGGGDLTADRTLSLDINSAPAAAITGTDEILFGDVDDANNIKKTTAQEIADLSAAAVTSVFTRIGDVVAQASDYDADQVDFDPTVLNRLSSTDVQGAIDELTAEVFPASGRIYYVDAANGNDSNSGLTVNDAFLTIQTAINAAGVDEAISILPGTYVENLSFNGKTNLTLVSYIDPPIDTHNVEIQGQHTFSAAQRIRMVGLQLDDATAVGGFVLDFTGCLGACFFDNITFDINGTGGAISSSTGTSFYIYRDIGLQGELDFSSGTSFHAFIRATGASTCTMNGPGVSFLDCLAVPSITHQAATLTLTDCDSFGRDGGGISVNSTAADVAGNAVIMTDCNFYTAATNDYGIISIANCDYVLNDVKRNPSQDSLPADLSKRLTRGINAIDLAYDNATSGLVADNVQDAIDELNTDIGNIPAAPVDSVNGQTGVVVLDADDIDDSLTTNKFATQAQLDQIATNTSDISTNTGNIATNTGNIATNTSNISTNTGNIATNTSDIATNTSDIATNTGNISTNAGNIATNTSDIATNTGNISTNTGNISTNTTNIGTNTTNIATNTADIAQEVIDRTNADAALQSQITNNDTDITNLQNGKADNTIEINTQANSGLTGGGDLTANRDLELDIDNLPALAPAATDEVAYVTGGVHNKATIQELIDSTVTPGTITYRKTYTCEDNGSGNGRLSWGNGATDQLTGAVVSEEGTIVSIGISTENNAVNSNVNLEVDGVVVFPVTHNGTVSVTNPNLLVAAGSYMNLNRTATGGGGVITATIEIEYTLNTDQFQGPQGNQGDPGLDGNSIITAQDGAPVNPAPMQAFYLDNLTGDYYTSDAGVVWNLQGNLTGPPGVQTLVSKFTNVAVANIQPGAATTFSGINTTALFDEVSANITVTADTITINNPGTYQFFVNIYQTTSVQRSNAGFNFVINGSPTNRISGSAYIRSQSGHNEASTNLSETFQLNATDTVQIQVLQLAAGGTVAAPVGQSIIEIRKLS